VNLLTVHPHCLMISLMKQDTRSCQIPSILYSGLEAVWFSRPAIDQQIREPGGQLKSEYFGSADIQLHAAALRNATPEQIGAIGLFFRSNDLVGLRLR